mmetsp:Transcript_9459/g.18226  ORF Transcript_9459/g.18226 Transcript_9459/m.18226 type:complete len:228 (+) Transcript_9459:5054-5737(+)
MSSIEDWFKSLPPFTRYYLVGALATTTLATFGILDLYLIYYDLERILGHFEVWRLLSNFLFFGKFGMGFFFSLVMLCHFGRQLETHASFRNNYADFVWCIAFLVLSLIIAGVFVTLPWLGSSLMFGMLYVWSRKDPEVIVNFWFGFQFKAIQFPFVLIVFRLLMGGTIIDDVAGLLAGHMYYYLKEVLPREYGYKPLETPEFVKKYFNTVPQFQRASSFVGRGYRLG